LPVEGCWVSATANQSSSQEAGSFDRPGESCRPFRAPHRRYERDDPGSLGIAFRLSPSPSGHRVAASGPTWYPTHDIAVDVSGEPYVDLEREAALMIMRE
jgi:hypothetical protein